MALQGNLRDFSATEILQLIASQKKSGCLALEWNTERAFIWVHDGRIVSTRQSGISKDDPLLAFLKATNRLSDEQVRGIVTIQRESNRDLEDLLVDGRYLDAEELAGFVERQILDDLMRIVRWDNGTYRFDPNAKWPNPPLVLISMEAAMMEAARRIDEQRRYVSIFRDPYQLLGVKDLPETRHFATIRAPVRMSFAEDDGWVAAGGIEDFGGGEGLRLPRGPAEGAFLLDQAREDEDVFHGGVDPAADSFEAASLQVATGAADGFEIEAAGDGVIADAGLGGAEMVERAAEGDLMGVAKLGHGLEGFEKAFEQGFEEEVEVAVRERALGPLGGFDQLGFEDVEIGFGVVAGEEFGEFGLDRGAGEEVREGSGDVIAVGVFE